MFYAELCRTVVHGDAHTCEQFLKLCVGILGLFFCVFCFSLDYFVALFATVLLALVIAVCAIVTLFVF